MRLTLYIVISSVVLAGCSITEPDVDYARTGVDMSSQLQIAASHVVPGLQDVQVKFTPGSAELDMASARPMLVLLDEGVQSVRILAPQKDALHDARQQALIHFLRGHGIESSSIDTASNSELPVNTWHLEVVTATITPPDCPNWSSSASTSYSNAPWSQLGCANVSNLSAMVADPQDLVIGSGDVRPDAQRDSTAIQQYHTNKDWTPAANGGGATASGTSFGGGGGGAASAAGAGSGSGSQSGGGGAQ